MKNVYQAFLNDNNIEQLIKLYDLIKVYKEKKHFLNEILDIFSNNLKKIFTFAFELCYTGIFEENFKNKLLKKMAQIKKDEDKQLVSGEKNNKKIIKNMKDKFKKQNIIKSEKLGDKNQIPDTKKDEEKCEQIPDTKKDEEKCVFCFEPLGIYNDGQKELTNYYGKIHYYFSDYLNDVLLKKPENKRKISNKFISCNHKIHLLCFVIRMTSSSSEEFECPLCNQLSNVILFDFSCIKKNTNKGNTDNFNDDNIIGGFESMNENIDFDNFYQAIVEDQGLTCSNMSSFEKYCSKLLGESKSLDDFNNDNYLLETALKLIAEDFETFMIYYSMTDKKQEQIEIWKNILLNLRYLFKYRLLKIPDILLNSNDIIAKVFENFLECIIIYDFCDIINKFIMICFIFFDSNQENVDKIINIFLNDILLYFIFMVFIKSDNRDNIDKFIIDNKTEIRKALNLFVLKFTICLSLFGVNVELPIEILEQKIPEIISSPPFLSLLNSNKINNYIEHIKEQRLEIPEFKIIDLPEKGMDFLNKADKDCMYCHKKNSSSYLCLFCGNKICFNINCFVNIEDKNEKEFSLVYHSLNCCGGNGLFLNISNAEIMYLRKRKVIESNIFIYSNDFGEIFKEKFSSDEYKLKKDQLEKGIKIYIDMTYRKRYSVCYFSKIILLDNKYLKK